MKERYTVLIEEVTHTPLTHVVTATSPEEALGKVRQHVQQLADQTIGPEVGFSVGKVYKDTKQVVISVFNKNPLVQTKVNDVLHVDPAKGLAKALTPGMTEPVADQRILDFLAANLQFPVGGWVWDLESDTYSYVANDRTLLIAGSRMFKNHKLDEADVRRYTSIIQKKLGDQSWLSNAN